MFDLPVVLGVLEHLIDRLLGQILPLLGAYPALAHLIGDVGCRIILRIQTEYLFYDSSLNGIDDILLVNDVIAEQYGTARVVAFQIAFPKSAQDLL